MSSQNVLEMLFSERTEELEQLINSSDFNTLHPTLERVYDKLGELVLNMTPWESFQLPLKALIDLVKFPIAARSLIRHHNWIPSDPSQSFENTVLGPFFHISLHGQSITRELEEKEIILSTVTIMNDLYKGLAQILDTLIRNSETREGVLQYFEAVINMQACTGCFVNVGATMLRLCNPDTFWSLKDKINLNHIRHLFYNPGQLTALYASPEEVAEWLGNESQTLDPVPLVGDEKFFVQSFFMTARMLTLGIVKSVSECKCLIEEHAERRIGLTNLRVRYQHEPSEELKAYIHYYIQQSWNIRNQLLPHIILYVDNPLYHSAIHFYGVLLCWIMRLVDGFKMPLSATCPKQFACMPKHFVDDACVLVINASDELILEGTLLEDYTNSLITFMASPNYVKDMHLRGKMSIVIQILWRRASSSLFYGPEYCLQYFVINLQKLYIDLGDVRREQCVFDRSCTIGDYIQELLKHLWDIPSYGQAWIKIAAEEENGVYLKFMQLLISDSILLVKKGLRLFDELVELKESIRIMERGQRTDREMEQPLKLFNINIKITLKATELAEQIVGIMSSTTEHITAPLLLPEMVLRVATSLNCLILQLFEKKRDFKELEEYQITPRGLLKKIVCVYIHLAKADRDDRFLSAISCLYEEKLQDAFSSLVKITEDLDFEIIDGFFKLVLKAATAASYAEGEEKGLGVIPIEFMDPIMFVLMKDPVILPSGHIIDRPVITRILIEGRPNPYTREDVTFEMLKPADELKAKIKDFIKSRSAK